MEGDGNLYIDIYIRRWRRRGRAKKRLLGRAVVGRAVRGRIEGGGRGGRGAESATGLDGAEVKPQVIEGEVDEIGPGRVASLVRMCVRRRRGGEGVAGGGRGELDGGVGGARLAMEGADGHERRVGQGGLAGGVPNGGRAAVGDEAAAVVDRAHEAVGGHRLRAIQRRRRAPGLLVGASQAHQGPVFVATTVRGQVWIAGQLHAAVIAPIIEILLHPQLARILLFVKLGGAGRKRDHPATGLLQAFPPGQLGSRVGG